MKSLMKTLSLLLAICLMLSLAACVPISTNPTNSCTEETALPTGSSQPTESSPAIPEDTTGSTEGTVVTEPTISPTAPSEEATTPVEEATSPAGSSETEPTETPIQYPLSYADETATITITREWFENAWCYIAHLQFTDYTRFGTACANGAYDNGFETTSHAAQRLGAIFTVNGCCSAPFLDYQPVNKMFLKLDYEDIHGEEVMKSMPNLSQYWEKTNVFYRSQPREQQQLFDPVTSYYSYLQTAAWKLAHYFGFLIGDELLQDVVPGYRPDIALSISYGREIRDYLKVDTDKLIA